MNDEEALEKLASWFHEQYPTKNMELCKSIVLSIADKEPIDFATMNFTNKRVRGTYRRAEKMAKEFLAKQSQENVNNG